MNQTSSRNLSQQVFTKTTGNRILLPKFDAIAVLAAPAALASLAALVFIPRNADQVPVQHRLDTVADIFRALIGKI